MQVHTGTLVSYSKFIPPRLVSWGNLEGKINRTKWDKLKAVSKLQLVFIISFLHYPFWFLLTLV